MNTKVSTGDKSIRSDAATYEALRHLAQEHQLSNTKLLAAMVQYFRVTKADPQQPKAPDLTSSLAQLSEKLDKLDKRTIGFIREQEKQYLKPILAQVQAQQALSTPAPSAPAGLNDEQAREVGHWFLRVLLLGVQPQYLSPQVLAGEPEFSAAMKAVQPDPALQGVKVEVLTALKMALRPECLTPRLQDKPAPSPAP